MKHLLIARLYWKKKAVEDEAIKQSVFILEALLSECCFLKWDGITRIKHTPQITTMDIRLYVDHLFNYCALDLYTEQWWASVERISFFARDVCVVSSTFISGTCVKTRKVEAADTKFKGTLMRFSPTELFKMSNIRSKNNGQRVNRFESVFILCESIHCSHSK